MQRITIQLSQIQETKILLTPQQQHYLFRVLRLQDGDTFIAMDGMGKWWLTQLTGEVGEILELVEVKTELPVLITLIVALPKGNGFDDIVRSCTELGVTSIVPVLSDRTLLNPSPQKLERWRRIAAEAAEQSERAFVPTILEPISFSTAINKNPVNERYICEGRGNYPHLTKVLNNLSGENIGGENLGKNIGEIVIATGPEGGWTEKEITMAINAKFQPVSLGCRILRAVTAPIVVLSLTAAAFEV
jgi:16S rRNA (uracil1498-N3)-methyltransferase